MPSSLSEKDREVGEKIARLLAESRTRVSQIDFVFSHARGLLEVSGSSEDDTRSTNMRDILVSLSASLGCTEKERDTIPRTVGIRLADSLVHVGEIMIALGLSHFFFSL